MNKGIIVRSTSNSIEVLLLEPSELGEFLIAESTRERLLFKIVGLEYRSDGVNLSYSRLAEIGEHALNSIGENFLIGMCKPICVITSNGVKTMKSIPSIYSKVRDVSEDDLSFLSRNGIFIGKLRNGSETINIDVKIDPKIFVPHHIIIAANTGKGKSNLLKVMVWSLVDSGEVGLVILDPHGEYSSVLERHPRFYDKVKIYSLTQKNGTNTLVINTDAISPAHFEGTVYLTDAQLDLSYLLYKQLGGSWIKELFNDQSPYIADLVNKRQIQSITVKTLQRRLMNHLGLKKNHKGNVFTTEDGVGEGTIKNIVNDAMQGMVVVIDTSKIYEDVELLISSIIASNLFLSQTSVIEDRNTAAQFPVGIILEEAPRVLGESVQGENIFKKIAKEGRKFGIGLIAVTQMTSVIPKEILANMNTKIILGNDSYSERSAIINSASQDLSMEEREIAILEKGEGIISSSLLNIAIPFKAPLVETMYTNIQQKKIAL